MISELPDRLNGRSFFREGEMNGGKKRLYVGDENNGQYFETYKTDKRLSVRIFKNATVYPAVSDVSTVDPLYGAYGVYDSAGVFCPCSAMRAGDLTPYPAQAINGNSEYFNESVIYGGVAYFHAYGHFLLESTARLWFVLQNSEDTRPVVFIPVGKPERYMEFFDLLGISRKRLIFINRPVRFKEIAVPEMSSHLEGGYTEEFMLPFRKAVENVPAEKYDKIYLTRRRFEFGNVCGEEILEKIFKANGYKIVSPERLSVKRQIALMKGAKSVVSVLGSATHNAIFCKKGTECVILNRAVNVCKAQMLVNSAAELDWCYVDTYFDCFPVSYFWGPYLVGMTSHLRSFCRDGGMKIPKGDIFPDAAGFAVKWISTYGGSAKIFNRLVSEKPAVGEVFSFKGLNFLERLARRRRNVSEARKLRLHLFRARILSRLGTGAIKGKYVRKVRKLEQKLEIIQKDMNF